MENILGIHLMENCMEEDHLIKTHLKNHHLIHMLDFMDGWHLIQRYSCRHGTPPIGVWFKLTNKLPYQKFQYLTYVKDTNLDAHIKVFKKVIKAYKKTIKVDIINLFSFTLKNNILKWGENFVQDHCPTYWQYAHVDVISTMGYIVEIGILRWIGGCSTFPMIGTID
jgi:hypothetical protein